ncbi:MAG: peptidase M2 family protein, partial [Gemmatimonadetes bacterium]|nr:peptidase M2 family protein [Gemmatimonadota bacterium]NIU76794.1 peptidase M2 family protein [Gammaproteobacteria bacterium]NIQ56592.1 peptidase M2 family protein [Gemmatimonadota bacterium]NIW35515.1 peptidase M2 family protein [Gemmatimonadota bacterium]NIX46179.1 peptidase M2 family protein [Gemmatimonadota bacterium]
MRSSMVWLALIGIIVSGCATADPAEGPGPAGSAGDPAPEVDPAAEAAAFADSAEAVLMELTEKASRAQWVQSNFITYDTEILAAEATEELLAAAVELAKGASRHVDAPGLDRAVARKLQILRGGLTMPAPSEPEKTAEVTRIQTGMESRYGRGEYCNDAGECWDLGEMTEMLATSRDEALLREIWTGWRTISPPMRDPFTRFVELGNEGARELGFEDVGAMWRSNYDMDPDAFAAELDRLWGQVSPLYDALHCHVRAELTEEYGPDVVPPGEPIPAHLLGNMWAQSWANIYDLVAPPDADPGYDLTERLRAEGYDAVEMVETGERFFTSLGFEPLPETFWE